MKKLLLSVLAALLAVALAPANAVAQAETGQLRGTVTDPTPAAVPGAKVVVTNVSTGAVRSVTTDDKGDYIITNLLPALYEVTVEVSGFAKFTRRAQITVGSRVMLDIQLLLGAAQQIVEVVGEAGYLVNVENQTIQQVIDTKKILELPTLTRNPYDLVRGAGNISEADPTGRGAGVAINGLRAASTNVLLDGAPNNDEFVAAVGMSVPLDAVQEFSVITSQFTAEYGRASAGIVNVVTKSGTNDIHGTAYWFGRYSALATNSFQNKANETEKPVFVRNQFGYSVGGPVIKNKLFFFQSTEWIRVRSQGTRFVVVPTAQFLAASATATRNFFTTYGTLKSGVSTLATITKQDLISGGEDPCNDRNTAGVIIFAGPTCNALPGTTPMFTRLSYNRPADSGGGSPQNTYDLVGRADWNVNNATTIYVRYALEKGNILAGSVADSPYQGFDTGQKTGNNSILFSLVRTWGPKWTTQSKVVYNRLNTLQPHGSQPSSPTLFFRTTTQRFLGDRAALPGYLPFSPGSGIPFGGPQNLTQYNQDVSYSAGSHQFRFGGSYVYLQDNRTFGAYQDPSATLGSTRARAIENFLTGNLLSFQSAIDPQGKFPCGAVVTPACTVNLPVGQPSFSRSNRYHEYAVYFQDSWKASRRLTLNLGMRWEYFGVQHNRNANLDSNYYDAAVGNIFQAIRGGDVATVPNSPIKGLWAKDWNNFGPRVGFALDVFGDGKTSLRGGYGIAYERNFGNVTFNVIQNPPAYAVISIVAGVDVPSITIPTNVAGPLAGTTGTKALPRVSLRNVDPNIRTAYAHTWSLTVEREMFKNLFLAVDYSGSKGTKLYSLENPNRPGSGNLYLGDPCTAGDPFSCTARLRTTQYTNINRRGDKAFSNHNSLNVRVTSANLANTGLTVALNYTYAHTLDNLSSTFSESGNNFNLGLLDPFNPRLDKGNADFDVRHRVGISGVWDIPFAKNTTGVANRVFHGWTIAPIFSASTGAPFSVFDCTNAIFSVCPRMFAVGAVPRKGASNPARDPSTPGTFTFINLAGFFDSSFVNPLIGSSEFGPFPANMTTRGFFRGPGLWNLDLGIYKTTKVTERFSLQFRAEFFNTFNHANMFVLSGDADVSGADVIRSQKDGRRNVQMALKLIF